MPSPPGFYRDPEDDSRFRYWTGETWTVRWAAPPGYYRPGPLTPVRYWSGRTWGHRYWSWWRVTTTVLLGIAAFFVGFGILGGVLGDPGPGGDTQQFEQGKQLASLLALAFPIAVRALASVIQLSLIRTRLAVRRVMRQIVEA
jgi:hypothetical protein